MYIDVCRVKVEECVHKKFNDKVEGCLESQVIQDLNALLR